MDPITILLGVIKGLIYGALAAGIGYLRTDESGHLEPFDKQKLVKTVIIGSILGGISSGLAINGMTMDQGFEAAANELGLPAEMIKAFVLTSITMFADQVVKVLWRRMAAKAVAKVKAYFA